MELEDKRFIELLKIVRSHLNSVTMDDTGLCEVLFRLLTWIEEEVFTYEEAMQFKRELKQYRPLSGKYYDADGKYYNAEHCDNLYWWPIDNKAIRMEFLDELIVMLERE